MRRSILQSEGVGQATMPTKLISLKIGVFACRATKKRLPVREELNKRGIDLHNMLCPCCNEGVESINHAMILCKEAWEVWEQIYKWWKIGAVNICNIGDIFNVSGNNLQFKNCERVW